MYKEPMKRRKRIQLKVFSRCQYPAKPWLYYFYLHLQVSPCRHSCNKLQILKLSIQGLTVWFVHYNINFSTFSPDPWLWDILILNWRGRDFNFYCTASEQWSGLFRVHTGMSPNLYDLKACTAFYSFNQYLLSIYYVRGIVLNTRDRARNKTEPWLWQSLHSNDR